MNFLVDAQLPVRLVHFFNAHGHDAIHTLDLPDQNRTTDSDIIQIADEEDRIVVSKDNDFLDNFILESHPKQLLIISTGNIHNDQLIKLIQKNLVTLENLFDTYAVIELNKQDIQIHY